MWGPIANSSISYVVFRYSIPSLPFLTVPSGSLNPFSCRRCWKWPTVPPVRASSQTMAPHRAFPVDLDHATVVSRWLVMPNLKLEAGTMCSCEMTNRWLWCLNDPSPVPRDVSRPLQNIRGQHRQALVRHAHATPDGESIVEIQLGKVPRCRRQRRRWWSEWSFIVITSSALQNRREFKISSRRPTVQSTYEFSLFQHDLVVCVVWGKGKDNNDISLEELCYDVLELQLPNEAWKLG